MARVNPWRDERDQQYQKVWGEYYRLWRGRHIASDKTRASERSRLVSPALSQALEMTIAELEEATFGRDQWVDILDDQGDPDHDDLRQIRTQFIEDMALDGVPSAISACYLNGGVWGTLAAKVVVEHETDSKIVIVPGEEGDEPTVSNNPRVRVRVVPIPVKDLIPDPEGETIDDMLGVVHEVSKPRASLLKHSWGREYAKTTKGSTGMSEDINMTFGDQESLIASDSNKVVITEWHGKVPLRLLPGKAPSRDIDPDDPLAGAVVGAGKEQETDLDGDGDMVEAIVTILDGKHLARAIENPFLLRDRSIVACQFERVPGAFHGRGVMEKGYNPQKALDAEIRTRMDVMALISNPMMGADSTALPRGFDMRVRPGKVWMTNGNPKEALFPIQFPGLDPSSFQQTSEMERMVQMGTGAMDTATPLSGNRRNETATGTSLIAGTFVKRSKRSLRNITDNFVQPLVKKILQRRMQYDAARYPQDFEFRIVGTLGIVAKELEQQQMTTMLSLVEPGSATQRVLVQSIFDASSSPYKAAMMKALEADAQPDPEAQAAEKQLRDLQMAAAQLDVQDKSVKITAQLTVDKLNQAKIIETMAKVEEILIKPGIETEKLKLARETLQKELAELQEFSRQNDISAFKAISDARGKASGNQQTTSDG